MCDVLNNKQFLIIRNKFLCCVPVKEIGLQDCLASISWDDQEFLLNQTVKNSLLLKFPIKTSYLKAFLKTVIQVLEKNCLEIHDSIYDTYCDILNCNEDEKYYYKHYLVEDKVLTLKENKHFISEGTTGLCSWQASLALSQWCYYNKNKFLNKTIVELGSGVGLVGLTLIQHCQPKEVILTDCHPKVLSVLSENISLNITKNKLITKESEQFDNFASGSTVSDTSGSGKDTSRSGKDTSGSGKDTSGSVSRGGISSGDKSGNSKFDSNKSVFDSNSDVLLSTVVDGIKVSVLNLPWEYVGNLKCCENLFPDIILAADVVYDNSVFKPLIGAVQYFLSRNCSAQVIFACTERNPDTLREFIDLLESSGFVITNIDTPKPELFYWSTIAPGLPKDITMSERRGTKALETWCRRLTEGYPGVKVENMTTSWRDGLAFCAIIHHFRPDLIDFASLTPSNIYYNNSLAFNVAERQLGIPALLDAEDMVMYAVPDRLSILTYLSQFYQVFGNQTGMTTGGKQGSSRIVPKRSAISTISADRGIISSASTSPATKMASRPSLAVTGGSNRREPCAKCGFPVFLAERLNVGTKLYHRTCFRCARCNNQLSLANCYETETDEYCCETCPDEEDEPTTKITKFDSLDNVKSISENNSHVKETASTENLSYTDTKKLNELDQVRNRSLSDEEKTKGLQQYEGDDEYSADFEHALEDTSNDKIYQDDSLLSKARNHFLSTHLLNEAPQIDSPPPLPESKPPDLSSITTSLTTEENFIPLVPESEIPVNTVELSSQEEPEDVNKSEADIITSEATLEETTNLREKNITKDINRSSLVKSRMLLFELANKESTTPSITKDKIKYFNNTKVPSEKHDISSSITVPDSTSTSTTEEEIKTEVDTSSELLENTGSEANFETVKSDINISDSIDLYSSIVSDNSPLNEGNTEPLKEELLSKSIIEDLSGDQTAVSLSASILEDSRLPQNEEVYPDDLNPFGDEPEETYLQPELKNLKQIIKPSMEDLTIITPPSKEEKRHSTNPFGSSDEEDNEDAVVVKQKPPRPPQPSRSEGTKRVLEAPKINLNPFWSDGEEPSDEESSKPVPMPRSKHLSTPEPKPRRSGLSNNASHYDSNSSISSMNSSIGHTLGRRKKPAPLPPKGGVSPEGSKQSSPSTSTQPSPKLTPRVRKNRKAPLPPTSTPFIPSSIIGNISVSPINNIPSDKTEPKSDAEETVLSPTGSDIEKEKITKDEKNRNRQSQSIASPVLSDSDSLSISQQCSSSTDKSTHGKWKRKKGPAPARPVPQRRQIRPLPLTELRRELDIIEMQQQGLEKQGVKLEQLIREQCEFPGSNDETALSPEVEDLVLELFELVNEKNELFRRQAELMYLRRQQRLEEEHADLEYQIRCLMDRPERNKTDSDKAREEELINRLLEVVERRNEIVECLEMDRVREAEEDQSINFHLSQLASKKEEEQLESPIKLSKKEKKKMKKEKKLKEKGKTLDADKDIDESETNSLNTSKEKKKKKWF